MMRMLGRLFGVPVVQLAVLVLAALASLASASKQTPKAATPPAPPPPQVKNIESGTVGTPGVVIASGDQQLPFTLQPGPAFQTPFFCNHENIDRSAAGFTQALQAGGKRVMVSYPGLQQKLYGVLCFYPVHNDCTGPGARSYLLQVPPEYVTATEDGRASVVFELTPGPENTDWTSWALWLSRQPL
jgi:hypothetical protein